MDEAWPQRGLEVLLLLLGYRVGSSGRYILWLLNALMSSSSTAEIMALSYFSATRSIANALLEPDVRNLAVVLHLVVT